MKIMVKDLEGLKEEHSIHELVSYNKSDDFVVLYSKHYGFTRQKVKLIEFLNK